MQQSAWQTIQLLRDAAATGDVAAAQSFLGDSAPGLRRSGIRQATFPEVDAAAIHIDFSDSIYVALADHDRLTSADGVSWTLDYGERPLATYRSPGGEPIHDLWWVEADGEHHLFVQVSGAMLSRRGLAVDVQWSFDPARPDDATYFRRSTVVISSVTFDGTPAEVAGPPLALDGRTSVTAPGTLTEESGVPARLAVGLTFTNPQTATSDERSIETVFALDVR
jgi:hypothetical protein